MSFDFRFEEDPIIRVKPPRRGRKTTHALPVWGTFLILLTVFLGGVGWGGWRLYDKHIRQPYFQEVKTLFREWFSAELSASPSGFETERYAEEMKRLQGEMKEAREKATRPTLK